MTEELKNKVELLEVKVDSLTQKVNELVSCLEDNELYRKVSVDYIYPEKKEEEEGEEEEKEETPEEKPKETKE